MEGCSLPAYIDEGSAYKTRALEKLAFDDLPDTCVANRAWDISAGTAIVSLDTSPEDKLLQWFRAPEFWTFDLEEGNRWFHSNSQGLSYLDKFIGKLLSEKKNLSHPMLGMHFAAYAQWCLSQNQAPRGRVFILMKTVTFRVEHHRLKSISLQTLLQLPLPSHKLSDIHTFVKSPCGTL